MAITYLGSGNLGYGTASGSITVPEGTTLLLVAVHQDGQPASAAGTIGGEALTVQRSQNFYYTSYSARLLYRAMPLTGSRTLAITGATVNLVHWIAYGGTHPDTPLVGTDTGNGTSEAGTDPAFTVASETGRLVFMAVIGNTGDGLSTGVGAGGDSTLRYSNETFGYLCGLIDEAGAGSVTINGQDVGTDPYWSWGAMVTQLNPADEGGGGDGSPLPLLMAHYGG